LILLPGGGRAIAAGGEIAMASHPVEQPGDWRKCTINVQVTMEGYEPLSFDLALEEQPTARTLVAK